MCAVVFDEITIKECVSYNKERDEIEGLEDFGLNGKTKYVANHAIVFMVRGLKANWKQPVGYFLSSGPVEGQMLHSLLQECIEKVEEVGLNVKAVIADQGSNNRECFKLLKVTEEQPFFFHKEKKSTSYMILHTSSRTSATT